MWICKVGCDRLVFDIKKSITSSLSVCSLTFNSQSLINHTTFWYFIASYKIHSINFFSCIIST
jgi:hypothetical protein